MRLRLANSAGVLAAAFEPPLPALARVRGAGSVPVSLPAQRARAWMAPRLAGLPATRRRAVRREDQAAPTARAPRDPRLAAPSGPDRPSQKCETGHPLPRPMSARLARARSLTSRHPGARSSRAGSRRSWPLARSGGSPVTRRYARSFPPWPRRLRSCSFPRVPSAGLRLARWPVAGSRDGFRPRRGYLRWLRRRLRSCAGPADPASGSPAVRPGRP